MQSAFPRLALMAMPMSFLLCHQPQFCDKSIWTFLCWSRTAVIPFRSFSFLDSCAFLSVIFYLQVLRWLMSTYHIDTVLNPTQRRQFTDLWASEDFPALWMIASVTLQVRVAWPGREPCSFTWQPACLYVQSTLGPSNMQRLLSTGRCRGQSARHTVREK